MTGTKNKYMEVRSLLLQMEQQLEAALARQMPVDRFVRAALTSLRRTPKLLECDALSLLGALMECAQLGLDPDSHLGHVYLVPFKGKVQLILGYRGIIRLARRSGDLSHIEARVVYSSDDFSVVFGSDRERLLRHVPAPVDRGDLIAAYAIARFRDGQELYDVVWEDDIKEAMASSRGVNEEDSPWKVHRAAMWRKTAVRRLEPFLPLDPIAQRGFALDGITDLDPGVKLKRVDSSPAQLAESEQDGGLSALTEKLKEEQ